MLTPSGSVPFFKAGCDYGYDIADYCDVILASARLDFDRLVSEAHRRGIRVMLDLVVNHSSHEHPWFKESRSSRDNPRRDWYIWRDGVGPRNRPPNNWRNHFFGPAWTYDEHTEQYYLHSFLPQQPDLNWFNPQVRRAVDDVVRFWLDRGADGFRLDVAHVYCKDEQFRSNPPFYRRPKAAEKASIGDLSLPVYLFYLLGLPELQAKLYNQHHPETHRVLKEFRKTLDEYRKRPASAKLWARTAGHRLLLAPATMAAYELLFRSNPLPLEGGSFPPRRGTLGNYCGRAWRPILQQPRYRSRHHPFRQGRDVMPAPACWRALLTLRGRPIYYGEEIGMKSCGCRGGCCGIGGKK